jgi:hypothetical protein
MELLFYGVIIFQKNLCVSTAGHVVRPIRRLFSANRRKMPQSFGAVSLVLAGV